MVATIILLLAIAAGLFFFLRSRGAADGVAASPDGDGALTLSDRIARFAEIGLHLNPGISQADVDISWNDGDDPWWSLFFAYGIEVEEEPWGRWMSDDVWNFDHEAIDDPGAYEGIVERHVALTGQPDLLRLTGMTFPGTSDGAVTMVLEDRTGSAHEIGAALNDDWVDAAALTALRDLICGLEGSGGRFWAADNGQAEVLTYLDDAQADALNALRPGLVSPAG